MVKINEIEIRGCLMNICIIPARGGSKRIPKKNIREFCGHPMISYSIVQAKKSGLFSDVMVSTDCPEIAEVANSYGAITPFLRPKSLSDDKSGTMAVVRHGLEWCMENGASPENACCLYATAPFTKAIFIENSYRQMISSQSDYSFTVTTFPFPIQRALKKTYDGKVEMFNPEYRETRSQDLEEAYHDAGQFYWGKVEAFLRDVPIFSKHSSPYIIDRHYAQDIDTEEDWIMAEYMFKAIALEGANA